MTQGTGFRFANTGRELLSDDRFDLISVGVDIGSATSQMIFSRLSFERREGRYVAVREHILHRSGILLTPYLRDNTIDQETLAAYVEEQYRLAGLRREDVETGAIILTGVALLRRNARAIGELFADRAGRFVSVSAGDHLEGMLAAHGSGAAALSRSEGPLLNIDIGGGTTKIALCDRGAVQQIVAVDVGARLIVRDAAETVVRLEPAARLVAGACGVAVEAGRPLSAAAMSGLAEAMAGAICEAAAGGPGSPLSARLLRTPPFDLREPVRTVLLSGGVSEFFYGAESHDFGDLGALLAATLRTRVEALGLRVLPGSNGIRATVVGASQYTVQVSGATIYVTSPDLLPLRNVPVVAPDADLQADRVDASMVGAAVARSLERLDLSGAEGPVAVCVRWGGSASYARLDGLARGLAQGLDAHVRSGNPVVLACDHDVGGLLGIHLHDEIGLPVPIVAVDGIELRELDFIDIGSVIEASGVVPVTIKSLAFPASGGAAGPA